MSALRPGVFRFQIVALAVVAVAVGAISVAGSTESTWAVVNADKRIDDRVSLDEELGVYLVERAGRTIALSNRGPWNDELVTYCPSSQLFETSRSGSKFDVYGHYFAGPAPRGMSRYRTRVVDGDILVDTSELIPGLGHRASKKRVRQPVGPYCVW